MKSKISKIIDTLKNQKRSTKAVFAVSLIVNYTLITPAAFAARNRNVSTQELERNAIFSLINLETQARIICYNKDFIADPKRKELCQEYQKVAYEITKYQNLLKAADETLGGWDEGGAALLKALGVIGGGTAALLQTVKVTVNGGTLIISRGAQALSIRSPQLVLAFLKAMGVPVGITTGTFLVSLKVLLGILAVTGVTLCIANHLSTINSPEKVQVTWNPCNSPWANRLKEAYKKQEELGKLIKNQAQGIVPSFENRALCMRAGGAKIERVQNKDVCKDRNGNEIDYQKFQKKLAEICEEKVKKELKIKPKKISPSAFITGKCDYELENGKKGSITTSVVTATPNTQNKRNNRQEAQENNRRQGNSGTEQDKSMKMDSQNIKLTEQVQQITSKEKITSEEKQSEDHQETNQLKIMKDVLNEKIKLAKIDKKYHEEMINRVVEDAQEIMRIQEEIIKVREKILKVQEENSKELEKEMLRLQRNLVEAAHRTKRTNRSKVTAIYGDLIPRTIP